MKKLLVKGVVLDFIVVNNLNSVDNVVNCVRVNVEIKKNFKVIQGFILVENGLKLEDLVVNIFRIQVDKNIDHFQNFEESIGVDVVFLEIKINSIVVFIIQEVSIVRA